MRHRGRYTKEQRYVAMQYKCEKEEDVYQFKLMQAINLPAYPRHAAEMKLWIEKLLNAICKLNQSGKHVVQIWIKIGLYPGPDADELLRWLESEYQG